MIVVIIIGALAAMAVPAFNKVRANSQAKACANNLRQLSSAKDQYFLENGAEATIALDRLVGPDAYIKATPECPAGGSYSDPLQPDSEPTCSSGETDHLQMILRLIGL